MPHSEIFTQTHFANLDFKTNHIIERAGFIVSTQLRGEEKPSPFISIIVIIIIININIICIIIIILLLLLLLLIYHYFCYY